MARYEKTVTGATKVHQRSVTSMTQDQEPKSRIILALAPEQDHRFVWEHVRTIQAQMFAAGPVEIKFAYFGAEGEMTARPFVATEWVTNADDMTYIMDEARTSCVCGCYVPIGDILEHALQETRQGTAVQAVIIVGDHFYGDINKALATAKQLRAAGTRLVFFQQQGGIGRNIPDHVFKTLADTTDGAHFQFNPKVERVAERLPGLLQAVSHLAIGGTGALKSLDDHDGAMLLLEQITK
jgi:hypothetical protein